MTMYKFFLVKDQDKQTINEYLKTTGVWPGFSDDGRLVIHDVDEENLNNVANKLINDFKLEEIKG